jgi:hypothetical protein
MSNGPKAWVQRALTAAAQNKKVLAIEGKFDVAVYREWLAKRLGPTWTNQVHLEKAGEGDRGGRSPLLAGLRWLQEHNDPDKDVIFGLADRDEWEPGDIAALQVELPTLLVNESRHSLESYFCDPDELDAALQTRDTATGTGTFAPHLAALRQQLENARGDYVPHWALGCTIQRANERIRTDEQYPAFFRDTCPLPADANVQAKLHAWAAMLDPAVLFASFDALRGASLARPIAEQFRSCVEPKLFFGRIVVAGAHGLNSIQQKPAEDWMIELARWSAAMPPDLEVTLNPVLT